MALDRISALPPSILQHVLCFLPQAEAVRTCVLSKSWRHLGCTRPIVEFREASFNGKEETFLSVVDETLRRYRDQNLSIHELRLQLSKYDSRLAARLWVPKLKILGFYLLGEEYSKELDIPSLSVFEVESLQKLYLERCELLYQECVVDNVLFKHLKTLHLVEVVLPDKNLKKIMSSCPLIESVTIHYCHGLTTIQMDDKLHNLKHFDFTNFLYGCKQSIEFNIPSIERIRISYCPALWFRNEYQRNLKSLHLSSVRLSSELFDFFSCNKMPSLESLKLVNCCGVQEFHLSSRSIKNFVFEHTKNSVIYNGPCVLEPPITKALSIDAPNILSFKYSAFYLPSLFSFTTTNCSPHEWKSNVTLDIGDDDSSLSLKLYEVLKLLSGSEISLKISNDVPRKRKITLGDKKAVVVDHLELGIPYLPVAYRSAILNELFDICHPRILVNARSNANGDSFLNQYLEMERNLEEFCMETHGRKGYDRFRLKWRSD